MEKLNPHRRCIVTFLVLALLHEWTLGRKPIHDMERLDLGIEDTVAAIGVLIKQGLVMHFIEYRERHLNIFQIINDPERFREAKILTDEGEQALKDTSLAELEKMWLRWPNA